MNPYERIKQLEAEVAQYQAMEQYLLARIQKLEATLCDKKLKTR